MHEDGAIVRDSHISKRIGKVKEVCNTRLCVEWKTSVLQQRKQTIYLCNKKGLLGGKNRIQHLMISKSSILVETYICHLNLSYTITRYRKTLRLWEFSKQVAQKM